MSDPQPAPGRREPPRAEPIQPDLPGRGTDVESDKDRPDTADEPADATKQRESQSDNALENVREGYD